MPDEYDEDGVMGGQALVLGLLNDVALGNQDSYKTLIEFIKKKAEENGNL